MDGSYFSMNTKLDDTDLTGQFQPLYIHAVVHAVCWVRFYRLTLNNAYNTIENQLSS